MRISDWSSDVCSSDLAPCAFSLLRDPEFPPGRRGEKAQHRLTLFHQRDGHRPSPPSAQIIARAVNRVDDPYAFVAKPHQIVRSEEHTSELQSLMRISYAVFCLKKKK